MGQVIAITGKGGVGKTTVAALIVKHLKETAQGAILALDADPDCNLATVLGIDVPETLGDLREETQRQIKDFPPGMSKEQFVEMGLHQIIVETPKVDLITMGRGEGSGCYCFVNNLLRKFADELMGSYEWVVMDNEAGLEHLSRHTVSRMDHLVVVVNANPLSIDCAIRIDALLAELDRDVRNRYVVLNATPDDRVAAVKDRLAGTSFAFLGSLPMDAALEEAIFRGESVYTLGETPAVAAVREMMHTIGAG
jgi:CO dehydrogenase maturation factor